MISINANTRIAEILRGHPAALEAIIGISPRFARLRNPLLRRLMAGRTSIAAASKIGGCTVNDFFAKLRGLGFVIEGIVVIMTLSTPFCPMGESITAAVERVLQDTFTGAVVEVKLTFDPPWNHERISEAGKKFLSK